MTIDPKSTIIITGAAGFIGSCMVGYLNKKGIYNLILVDDFTSDTKKLNLKDKTFYKLVERTELFNWLARFDGIINAVVHMGARTDTAEFDYSIHQKLNVEYSQDIWRYCTKHQIPFIYASSAATYGAGEFGYIDDHDVVAKLKPLNPYGISKNEFDKWALMQTECPPNWAGLKFFNVYGPNEYHKGRMASVIWHSFNQIQTDGLVKLFKSYKPAFDNGWQLRDFIYVKDILKVVYWLMNVMFNKSWPLNKNGLYNLGTGKARSFYDLVTATFNGLGKQPEIEFIDMPVDIRDKYQYFTEANMNKLKSIGYNEKFYTLEEGISDYVRNYLSKQEYY